MMEEQIYNIIFNEGEISWQSLLMDLVKQEGMDPWNVDVSKLANSYVKKIKQLKELNLAISGKVILASALLLKVKSKLLIGSDLDKLDDLFKRCEEEAIAIADFEENIDLLEPLLEQALQGENAGLTPRTPQPRIRKVSIFDLVAALEKAMAVRKRRLARELPRFGRKITMPTGVDISEAIINVYADIKERSKRGTQQITFRSLVPHDDKNAKIFTFIPLLHLHTQRRVDLEQQEHFGEIVIQLVKKKKIAG